jgi:predicted MFS family arabinose efflux permease
VARIEMASAAPSTVCVIVPNQACWYLRSYPGVIIAATYASFSCAAFFVLFAAVTSSKFGTLLLLCLSYAGICLTQPMIFPTCIEVARKFPGSTAGAQNTTNQLGSFLSGVLFGYVARISGSYDRPLILMVLVLGFGALMWLKIDPTQELIPEGQPEHATA